jgi:hypothetical protein
MIYTTPARAQWWHARFNDELIIYSNGMDERVSHRIGAVVDEVSERTGRVGLPPGSLPSTSWIESHEASGGIATPLGAPWE